MNDIVVGIKLTADGKGARAEIVGTVNDLGKLDQAGSKAKSGLDKAGKASRDASQEMRRAASAAGALVGAFTGLSTVAALRGFIVGADAIKAMESRIKLTSGTIAEYQRALEGVTGVAYRYNQSLDDTSRLYTRLAPIAQDLGRTQADLVKVMGGVGAALRVSGATAAEQSSTITQLTQSLASANVQWEDFGQLQDTAPALVRATEKALSGLVAQHGSLKQAVAAGAVSNRDLFDVLVKIAPEFERQAATIDGPVSGGFTNLKNAMSEAAGAMDKIIGLTGGLSAALNAVAESVKTTADRWKTLFPSEAAGDQVSAFRDRIIALKKELEGEGLSWFPDQEKMARLRTEIEGMERAFVDLKKQAEASANAGTEAFKQQTAAIGNAGAKIESMSKSQLAIMAKVAAEAKRQGVEVAAALAIAEQESGFNQAARAKTKYGDAIGVMQLIPPTANRLGVDAKNLEQNIEGGVRLIKQVEAELVAALGDKGHDLQLIAAAYFTGTKNVVDSIKKTGALPGFQDSGGKTVPAYASDISAKIAKYRGADKEITANLETELKERDKAYADHFAAVETMAKANAKAQETIAKSSLSVEIAKLEQQRKAYEDYVRARSGELTGQNQTQFLEQAARTESNLIQQSVALKQRAIDIEGQATQAELASIQQRIQAKDQLKLSESQVAQLMGEQKELTAELASFDAQSNTVRIQGAGELQRALSDVADAYAKQAEAAQQAAAARDDLLKNLDAEITALEKGATVRKEVVEAEKAAADLGKEAHDAYMKQFNERLARADQLKKAQDDQQKQEKAVADQVLRTGQYYEAMVRQAQNAASGMAAAFGETGAAIGQLVVGLAQYQDTMYNIQQRTEALLKANRESGGGADQEMEIRAQAMNQELTAQINNYGNLTQAAQSFFDKGTSGYQAMENATKVFRAVELAMTLANYVQMAAAGWTFTVQDAAQKQVQGQNAALVGIANQATGGDPYSAFPRMAAMAAAMAALGFAVAGGMSGGGAPSGAVSRSGPKSSGTVFGDSSAQSNSLANALDLVAKNSSTDLAYSAAMLRSLQNIEAAMAGVTNSVLRTVRPADVQGLGTRQTISWDPFAIFLKTTKAITDWGIGAFPQALKTILASGFEGKTFTDVTTSVKFFGMTLSSSTKTMIGDMASETEKQFTLAFKSIADTVREASKAFGTSAEDFNRMVETFVVKFDTTSLKGLKGEELEKAIQGQFSKIADQIAASLNISGLEEFQKVGEGMFETLVRVADGINTANAELAALGIEAVKYSEIQFKQGDVASEITRQSIVAFEGLESGIGSFIDAAVGSAEELIQTYQDLLQSRDILKGLGLDFENLNRTMTDAAGGVSKFLDALQSFRDNFFSSGEQYATQLTSLSREFGNLGLALPSSKDEFRALAESIDTSTAAGAELFARLIKLSDAFATASDAAEDLERKYASYTDPFFDFKDRIQTVMDDFESILAARLGGIEAKYGNQAALAKQQVNGPLQAEVTRLGGILGTRQAEAAAEYATIAQAQSRITELQDLINRAMASGNAKLAGYVRSWMGEIDYLNSAISTLNADITAKMRDIDAMNNQIAELEKQIAQNSADIDAGQLSAKLEELTKERARILREQGDALVRTMQDIWEGVVGVIEDAQDSLRRQIAELTGPRAVAKLAASNQRSALGDLNRYLNAGGTDPAKTVDLVTKAQQAIMDRYNARLEVLLNQLEREKARMEREIRKSYQPQRQEIRQDLRETERAINKQLRIDTRALNADLRATTRAISQAANQAIRSAEQSGRQRINAIERAGEAAIEAYRATVQAQIDGINAAMDAALQALEDRQLAEQDALSDAQDARMEVLQDAQQAETKALQKAHDTAMSALQDQLSAAQSLKSALAQVADYARQLKTSDISSLSPQDKLAEAARQYQDLFAKAPTDAEAAGKVTDAADTYLRLAESFFGRGTQFDQIFRGVQSGLENLGNTAVSTDPVEAAIEALQASQEAALEALQKAQQDESKALQRVFRDESRALSREQQDASEALRKTFQDRIDRVTERAQKIEERMQRDTDKQVQAVERETQKTVNQIERQADKQINAAERATQRQINQLERQADRAISAAERQADRQMNKLEREIDRLVRQATSGDSSEAIRDLKERTIEKLRGLDTVLTNAKEQAAQHAREQIEYLRELGILNTRQLRQLNRIGAKMGAETTDVPQFASGGVLKPGLATVAERGIEPIWFDRGGRVLSNSEAKASLSDGDRKIAEAIAELKEQVAVLTRAQVAANSRLVPAVEATAAETAAARRDAKIRPGVKV